VTTEACVARLCSHTFSVGLNLDGTNFGSCWYFQRAKHFGQRELSLPHAWKSLLCVACLAFLFLHWLSLLMCSGRAGMTAILPWTI